MIIEDKNDDRYDGEYKKITLWDNNLKIFTNIPHGYGIKYFNTYEGLFIYKGMWDDGYMNDSKAILVHPDGEIKTISCVSGTCDPQSDIEIGEFKECSYHLTPDSVILDNSDLIIGCKYTDRQLQAIKLYTKDGHRLISLYLRAGHKFTISLYTKYLNMQQKAFRNKDTQCDVLCGKFSLQKMEQFYQDLKSCFITTYDRDVIVYRGIPNKPDIIEGGMFRSRIFMSTSIDLLPAYKFSLDSNQGEPGNTLKIIIPRGTPVCQILDLSEYAFNDEREILLNADSTFVCTQGSHNEIRIFITADEKEPDYNPNVTYKTLENGQIETTAVISMIELVLLQCNTDQRHV